MSPMTRVLIIGIVFAAVVLVLGLKHARSSAADDPLAGFDPSAPTPVEPTPTSYEPSVTGIPRLASLGAGKCIPCKAMAPIRAELCREYAGVLAVDFYDVWKDPDARRHFGIWGIPTLIFYDAAGRELGRRQGFTSKAQILAAFEGWGVRLRAIRTR